MTEPVPDLLAALQASFTKARSAVQDLSSELDKAGGFLRCEECGRLKALKSHDASFYVVKGWPKHCGYTMRWWTQRQIDAGEVPNFRDAEGDGND